MIINSITYSAGGNEITLRGGLNEYCVITKSDAQKFGLYEVDDEDFPIDFPDDELLEFLSQKLKALRYCSYLLSFSDKSEKTLREKLKDKEYSTEVANEALDVLRGNGIISDDRLALRKMQQMAREKLYGPYRLRQELMAKGFSSQSIKDAEENAEINYGENLISLIEKLTRSKEIDFSDTAQLVKFKAKLSRYGYGFEQINSALNEYKETNYQ